jgi:integrase
LAPLSAPDAGRALHARRDRDRALDRGGDRGRGRVGHGHAEKTLSETFGTARAVAIGSTLRGIEMTLLLLMAPPFETVTKFADRWHAWRETRGLQCVKDDRARMTNHVLKWIGELDVRTTTRRDLEKLVESLDERILKGEIGWKVAAMAWNNVSRMFKDGCSAKKLDLRVRDDNPAVSVQGPERGMKKGKQYLWPSEFLALITCPKVPLRWRRLFALAVYGYMRAGEIAILGWDDVSTDTMTIHVHQSGDRVRKKGGQVDQDGRLAAHPDRGGTRPSTPRPQRRDRGQGARHRRDAVSRDALAEVEALPQEGRGEARRAVRVGRDPQGHHVSRSPGDRDHLDGRPRRRPLTHHAARRARELHDDPGLHPRGGEPRSELRPGLPPPCRI